MLENLTTKQYIIKWMKRLIYHQHDTKKPLPTVNILLHCYSHVTGAVSRKIDKTTTIDKNIKAPFKNFILCWLRKFKASKTLLELNSLLQVMYRVCHSVHCN